MCSRGAEVAGYLLRGDLMAPLRDPDLLKKFLEALTEWRCDGYIVWKRRAAEWLRKNLDGCTQQTVNKAMHDHFVDGGEIDQTKENYEGYRDTHPYHYDFRLSVDGRPLYIETVFDDTRMGPTITIVNLKDKKDA
jgi:hypothetical protein